MMKRIFSMALAAALLIASLSACGGGAGKEPEKQADLAAFAQSVTENHDFSGFIQRIDTSDPDLGEMMTDMLAGFYPGLTDLDLEQMEIYMSMISFGSGELAVVQAKSAGDAAKVKEIFQARVDSKSTEGAGNYPEEVELWQRSSAVTENGSYVMLVCAEDCDAIVGEFNDLFK